MSLLRKPLHLSLLFKLEERPLLSIQKLALLELILNMVLIWLATNAAHLGAPMEKDAISYTMYREE